MRRPLSKLALVAALALAATLLAQPVAQAGDPGGKLEDVKDQLQRKKAALRAAERREAGLLKQIAASDQRRAGLEGRVAALELQLADAETRLAAVQHELNKKEKRLAYLELRLRVTNDILRGQIETLNSRAAMAYEFGPGMYLSVLMGADSFTELVARQEFLQESLVSDSDAVESIRQTKALVAEQEALVQVQRNQIEAQRDRVQAEVDRIDGLRAEQQFLLEAVERELEIRHDALAQIRDNKAAYKQAIKNLQEESERLQALIEQQGSSGPGHYGGELYWPTAGGIGSGFGWRVHPIYGYPRFHAGVDIGGACGQPIWAAEDGVVISAGYNGGYGYATVIDHGGGLSTLYAHQPYVGVSYGEQVNRAEQIGVVGSTGLSTACHLHFEVRVNGVPVDPVPYLT